MRYVRAVWTLAVRAAGGIGRKGRSLAALVTQPALATTECIHLDRYNLDYRIRFCSTSQQRRRPSIEIAKEDILL